METDQEEINIGIIDIYGFEIFEVIAFNGFCVEPFSNQRGINWFCELSRIPYAKLLL